MGHVFPMILMNDRYAAQLMHTQAIIDVLA